MIGWIAKHAQAFGAIGAMLVGIAALFIAWEQAQVMRAQQEIMQEQQHGAVYPVLQIDGFVRLRDGRRIIGVEISNSGVGPALIDEVVLLREGAPRMDFTPVTDLMPDETGLNWSTMIGRVLAAGETVTPMEFSWPDEALSSVEMDALLGEWIRWDMTACYCSVFGRCWQADTRGVGRRPEPVEACPIPDEDFFEELGEIRLGSESE